MFNFDVMDIINEYEEPKGTPLEYKQYKEYEIPSCRKGQWIFRFPNKHGASVAKRPGSYGYKDDLFEVAVLLFPEEETQDFILDYSTPITDDVIGYLSNENVLEKLEQIKGLEKSED